MKAGNLESQTVSFFMVQDREKIGVASRFGFVVPPHRSLRRAGVMEQSPLTNTLRPLTDSFLTIRIIKSFQFRTSKNLLLPHVDLVMMTVGELKALVLSGAWWDGACVQVFC